MKTILKKIANLPALKTNKKLIVFLSDDWGSVRIKSLDDQKELVAKGLKINNRFDQFDTLESNTDMEALFEVLLKHKDHKGNHPVITAVTNVANPDFKRIKEEGFKNYYYESIEQTYQRYPDSDKVLGLVKQGIRENIFVPQSHGREHLQVNWWMQELQQKKSFSRKVFENEFFFFQSNYIKENRRGRNFSAAFDVWDKRDIESHQEIIKSGLDLFKDLYGYGSEIFTPPAMFYNPAIEPTLLKESVDWIDVGRFFKIPLTGGGEQYQFNYLGRKKKSGLKVLVRNAVFETNMSQNDNGVLRCMHDIEDAFKAKQPALISNHKASFVGGIDTANRNKGLTTLDKLLTQITTKWGDVEFISAKELSKL
jgi:hypothetical protein